jgi:sterol desaturase/sphingolipid hydroxylase (fatty acid hydroxylase superfamily)
MNASTWARDHFLQESWRAFFSVFTLGLIVDLHLAEAGKVALYSTTFLIGMSMFYHSADPRQITVVDRLLVTPQVHRIHHSVDAEHYNRNFADALPIFDIVFGTYYPSWKRRVPCYGPWPPTSQHPVHCYPRNSARSGRSGSCCDERAT